METGRIGNLTQDQQQTLNEFRSQLQQKQVFKEQRHDDQLLLRFLRARKFDLTKTMDMFLQCEEWRSTKQVDEIFESFKFDELPAVNKIYPRFYHGTDKLGRPIYVEVLGLLDLDQLFKITTRERLEKYFIYEYERLMRVRLPSCTAAAASSADDRKLIETSLTILDLKDCSVMQGLKIKDLIQQVMQIGQNYYPETMGLTFVINAPWLFDTVWNVVKMWLDEVTVKKIFIFKSGKDYTKTLFQHVDPSMLPTRIGGTCTQCPNGCETSDIGPWKSFGK